MATHQDGALRASIQVLIVDDHPIVREGLIARIACQPDMHVCGEAADVGDALQLVAATRPDIVLVDISLQSGNGIELIKRIKTRDPGIRMLVCSMYSEALYAERALHAGALGFINKADGTNKIIEAIRCVLTGKVYLSPTMAEQLLNRVIGLGGKSSEPLPIASLSDRELEVFELIGHGHDTHEVARRMRVSPKTVETYRARIKEKLCLHTVTELIQRAVQWTIEKC